MITQGVFIADRYEVIDKVGSGGMSDVYRAKDHILGREVAVKILKPEFSEDATFVAKFRTEAQSAAGLEHPNIVNIYDVGSENGMYFIVMEYVEGITLKTYIEKKGQLNFKEAISIAIQVGRGIEAAHQKGIIHRDIKPQNIIISTEGKVKVTDFGIARAASSNTIHADVMGSVHYSSPEQARNGFVDGKSDIYSLGIVMYEMVTGRVPFDGDNTVAIAIQHLQEEMVTPSAYAPDLPISLEKIILKATMKSADRRYATISDLLLDLKRALVSPDEDFVTIADSELAKTRVMPKVASEPEESLTKKAAQALIFDDDFEEEEEEYDDEYYDDEEYYDDDYYDDDEYDEREAKKDKILTISGIVAGVAIVIILVLFLGNVTGLFKFGSKTVTMINVVGTQYDSAIEELTDLGLDEEENIVTTYEEDSDEEDGTVIFQSVEEGEEFSLKDTLRLTVAGEDPEDSKDSSDSSSSSDDSSKSDSSDSSSSSSDSSSSSSNSSSSTDTTSTDTSTDSSSSTDSSDGTVAVPSVVGLTQAEATTVLDAKNIIVTSTSQEYSDSVASGLVISQSIEPGTMVSTNTKISLVISKGAKTTTYSYTISNPYDGECTYSIAELNKTGTIPKSGAINVSGVTKSSLTVTLSYTPMGADGVTPDTANTQTTTTTVQGTAE